MEQERNQEETKRNQEGIKGGPQGVKRELRQNNAGAKREPGGRSK